MQKIQKKAELKILENIKNFLNSNKDFFNKNNNSINASLTIKFNNKFKGKLNKSIYCISKYKVNNKTTSKQVLVPKEEMERFNEIKNLSFVELDNIDLKKIKKNKFIYCANLMGKFKKQYNSVISQKGLFNELDKNIDDSFKHISNLANDTLIRMMQTNNTISFKFGNTSLSIEENIENFQCAYNNITLLGYKVLKASILLHNNKKISLKY